MKNYSILQDYPEVLTVNDVITILHTSKLIVYRYLKNGTIKSVKMGREYRIPKVRLIEYLMSA